jgi:antitoxin PrlF
MSRMTSKGQVTIPKRIRDHLGLKPGAEVEFENVGDGRVLLKAERSGHPKGRFAAVRGILGPGMTTNEVMRLTRGWGEPDHDVK